MTAPENTFIILCGNYSCIYYKHIYCLFCICSFVCKSECYCPVQYGNRLPCFSVYSAGDNYSLCWQFYRFKNRLFILQTACRRRPNGNGPQKAALKTDGRAPMTKKSSIDICGMMGIVKTEPMK